MLSPGTHSSLPAIDRLKSGKSSSNALPEKTLVLSVALERLSWKKPDCCGAALRATLCTGRMGFSEFDEADRLVC